MAAATASVDAIGSLISFSQAEGGAADTDPAMPLYISALAPFLEAAEEFKCDGVKQTMVPCHASRVAGEVIVHLCKHCPPPLLVPLAFQKDGILALLSKWALLLSTTWLKKRPSMVWCTYPITPCVYLRGDTKALPNSPGGSHTPWWLAFTAVIEALGRFPVGANLAEHPLHIFLDAVLAPLVAPLSTCFPFTPAGAPSQGEAPRYQPASVRTPAANPVPASLIFFFLLLLLHFPFYSHPPTPPPLPPFPTPAIPFFFFSRPQCRATWAISRVPATFSGTP